MGVQRQLKRDQAVSSGATGPVSVSPGKEAGAGTGSRNKPLTSARASAGACVGATAQIPEKGSPGPLPASTRTPAWGGTCRRCCCPGHGSGTSFLTLQPRLAGLGTFVTILHGESDLTLKTIPFHHTFVSVKVSFDYTRGGAACHVKAVSLQCSHTEKAVEFPSSPAV